jgi:hypothetical protein
MSNHLVGAAEAARILGVSRQRLAQLVESVPEFPQPEVELAAGRIWRREAVQAWSDAHPTRARRGAGSSLHRDDGLPPYLERILNLASAQARDLNHNWVGSEHLLLGLMQKGCPGLAPSILHSFAVTLAEVRAALVEALGDPHERSAWKQEIPPATQLVLERARLRARELQDLHVNSEHVLLVLTEKWDLLAVSGFLRDRGLEAEAVRERVLRFTETSKPHLMAGKQGGSVVSEPVSQPPGFDLAPTPAGLDPRRRLPWGSEFFVDLKGNPARQGSTLAQYLVDRDGCPILTIEGRPIHLRTDDDGKLVLDEEGRPMITPVQVPADAVWPQSTT